MQAKLIIFIIAISLTISGCGGSGGNVDSNTKTSELISTPTQPMAPDWYPTLGPEQRPTPAPGTQLLPISGPGPERRPISAP